MRLGEHKNETKDVAHAKALRADLSPIEKKLWTTLREPATAVGLRFRRQQPIHPYIADFACMKARLLIEIDGDTHTDSGDYDRNRDAYLKKQGYTVIRYCNDDVVQNCDGVVADILAQALNLMQNLEGGSGRRSPLPNPPREGEGNPPSTTGICL